MDWRLILEFLVIVVLEKNLLTKTQLDDILKPENMTHPRKLSSRA